AYRQYCQSCHGADLRGAVPGAASIVSVTDRMDDDAIRSVVNEGRGTMRQVEIGQAELTAIIAYLSASNPNGRGGGAGAAAAARGRGRGRIGGESELPPGPVVARGGAPQPALPARYGGPFYPGVGGNAG